MEEYLFQSRALQFLETYFARKFVILKLLKAKFRVPL
jgi:hypothetical protein